VSQDGTALPGTLVGFASLTSVMGQLSGVDAFIASARSFIEDEWDDERGRKPSLARLNVDSVLAALRKLHLRFDTAGHAEGESFFTYKMGAHAVDDWTARLLHLLGRRLFKELGLPFSAMVVSSTALEDLVVVPDTSGVVSLLVEWLATVSDEEHEWLAHIEDDVDYDEDE
jgi:hypothetical protein